MSRNRSVQKGGALNKRGERSSLRAQQKIWGEREFAPSKSLFKFFSSLFLAEWTGLEPATPGVTGRYSNQLNYHSTCGKLEAARRDRRVWWVLRGSNSRHSPCKGDALPTELSTLPVTTRRGPPHQIRRMGRRLARHTL